MESKDYLNYLFAGLLELCADISFDFNIVEPVLRTVASQLEGPGLKSTGLSVSA